MNVLFGNTTSIRNGTQKNMQKFGTTERTCSAVNGSSI